MSPYAFIAAVDLLGIMIWFVNTVLPAGKKTKRIISATITICVMIWILQGLGFINHNQAEAGQAQTYSEVR